MNDCENIYGFVGVLLAEFDPPRFVRPAKKEASALCSISPSAGRGLDDDPVTLLASLS